MKLVPAQIERGPGIFHYWCPGCNSEHSVFTQFKNEKGAKWAWNGDLIRPTFSPSLLHTWTSGDPPITAENFEKYKSNPWPQNQKKNICHVFIKDGRIQFLSDCTHTFAGKTVDLPDMPNDI